MPFKSEAQRRFMWSQHPDIAKRWSKEYPNQGHLPARMSDGEKRKEALKRSLKRG